jgi:hypothetical protein
MDADKNKNHHPDLNFKYESDKRVKWFQHFLSLQEYFQAIADETWTRRKTWERLYYSGSEKAPSHLARLFKLWFDLFRQSPSWQNPPIKKFSDITAYNKYKEDRRLNNAAANAAEPTNEETPSEIPEAQTSESPEETPESQNYSTDEEN